jgi:hypothetical protein
MGFKTGSFISVGNRGLNPTNSLARTRRVNNPVWNFTLPHTFQGTVAGYTSGGRTENFPTLDRNVIDKFPFATDAGATDVGDLTRNSNGAAGQSSDVSGYTSGGNPTGEVPAGDKTIDKFPFATNANATDVGDLTVARREISGGQSSTASGYTTGGDGLSPPVIQNVIDKFPFATNANATDVGDLTVTRYLTTGQSSDVSGYTSGGAGAPVNTIIDKFPFATDANATDVGDLIGGFNNRSGQSSTVSGYVSGGGSTTNIIEKFPFATNANATDVGDLFLTRGKAAGQSSTVSGYTSGGQYSPSPGNNATIDKFSFASDSNATSVGNLSAARYFAVGQQD